MTLISVVIYFLVVALLGWITYEGILRRNIKKYQTFSKKVEDGSLEALPEKHKKEPVRLTGPVYYIAIIGIGFLVTTALFLVAFGACLVVLVPMN